MSTPPRSRLFDSANHHLDDPTVLQAGIDLELNRLPADHAFHDLSHTGIPLVSDVAVLAHVRELGWLSRVVSSILSDFTRRNAFRSWILTWFNRRLRLAIAKLITTIEQPCERAGVDSRPRASLCDPRELWIDLGQRANMA